MKLVYYILTGITIFIARQILANIFGHLADLLIVVPAVFIWLWFDDHYCWWLLLLPALLLDSTLVRVLPFYILASLTSIIIYYALISPNFSFNSNSTRLIIYFLAIIIWRLSYIVWLAVGWFLDGSALVLNQTIIWSSLTWIISSLVLVLFILTSRQLIAVLRHKFFA